MESINVCCNICNSDDYEILYPEGKAQIHRIVKCNNCGLIYANPQTTHSIGGKVSTIPSEIDDLSVIEQSLSKFTPEKNSYLKKQYIQGKDYKTVLDYFYNKPKGRLLEVGSFAGVFLSAAKDSGWDVLGIEPMLIPRLYSEREFGLNVLPSPFELCSIAEESIDLIVSFHVIEHVYDPKKFVLKAAGALRKNGVLVLETPTYDSLTYKILKHRERSVRCNGHMYFFTKETLKGLVESSGFRVIKHETVGRTLSIERLFTNFGIMSGKVDFFDKLSSVLKLNRFTIYLNMRDMQRVYCEKI